MGAAVQRFSRTQLFWTFPKSQLNHIFGKTYLSRYFGRSFEALPQKFSPSIKLFSVAFSILKPVIILLMVSWFLCMCALTRCGNSFPEVYWKEVVLRNFAKFKGKPLCQSLFLIKLQASGVCFQHNELIS